MEMILIEAAIWFVIGLLFVIRRRLFGAIAYSVRWIQFNLTFNATMKQVASKGIPINKTSGIVFDSSSRMYVGYIDGVPFELNAASSSVQRIISVCIHLDEHVAFLEHQAGKEDEILRIRQLIHSLVSTQAGDWPAGTADILMQRCELCLTLEGCPPMLDDLPDLWTIWYSDATGYRPDVLPRSLWKMTT